jgi:hypothetical protein
MFLHVIQLGYEYLIENNMVDIDVNLFRDFIKNKVESLEPVKDMDYNKIKNNPQRKSHLIC